MPEKFDLHTTASGAENAWEAVSQSVSGWTESAAKCAKGGLKEIDSFIAHHPSETAAVGAAAAAVAAAAIVLASKDRINLRAATEMEEGLALRVTKEGGMYTLMDSNLKPLIGTNDIPRFDATARVRASALEGFGIKTLQERGGLNVINAEQQPLRWKGMEIVSKPEPLHWEHAFPDWAIDKPKLATTWALDFQPPQLLQCKVVSKNLNVQNLARVGIAAGATAYAAELIGHKLHSYAKRSP